MAPAIVVITYNRPQSLMRLLSSIANAVYETPDIELIISIDYQDSAAHEHVLDVAEKFNWNFGHKKIIAHDRNIGLKNHVLSCGEFTAQYGSIIMLEDDLLVSPLFYLYAKTALEFYSNDDRIGGISLYNHRKNFCNRLPFDLVGECANDVYFLQIASSWGQAWSKEQWADFKEWYNEGQSVAAGDLLPKAVKNWPETSWLKYFIKYLVVKDKYFVYPKTSLSTNFGDSGTHNLESDTNFQVPLLYSSKYNIQLRSIEESINIYDCFFELKASIIQQFNPELAGKNIIIDLYGLKDLSLFDADFVISKKQVTGDSLASYGLSLKPAAANIMSAVVGNHFNLATKELFINDCEERKISNTEWTYFYGRADIKKIGKMLISKVIRELNRARN